MARTSEMKYAPVLASDDANGLPTSSPQVLGAHSQLASPSFPSAPAPPTRKVGLSARQKEQEEEAAKQSVWSKTCTRVSLGVLILFALVLVSTSAHRRERDYANFMRGVNEAIGRGEEPPTTVPPKPLSGGNAATPAVPWLGSPASGQAQSLASLAGQQQPASTAPPNVQTSTTPAANVLPQTPAAGNAAAATPTPPSASNAEEQARVENALAQVQSPATSPPVSNETPAEQVPEQPQASQSQSVVAALQQQAELLPQSGPLSAPLSSLTSPMSQDLLEAQAQAKIAPYNPPSRMPANGPAARKK